MRIIGQSWSSDNGEIRGIELARELGRMRTFYNGSSHSGSKYLRVYVTIASIVTRRPDIKLIPWKISNRPVEIFVSQLLEEIEDNLVNQTV